MQVTGYSFYKFSFAIFFQKANEGIWQLCTVGQNCVLDDVQAYLGLECSKKGVESLI